MEWALGLITWLQRPGLGKEREFESKMNKRRRQKAEEAEH